MTSKDNILHRYKYLKQFDDSISQFIVRMYKESLNNNVDTLSKYSLYANHLSSVCEHYINKIKLKNEIIEDMIELTSYMSGLQICEIISDLKNNSIISYKNITTKQDLIEFIKSNVTTFSFINNFASRLLMWTNNHYYKYMKANYWIKKILKSPKIIYNAAKIII